MKGLRLLWVLLLLPGCGEDGTPDTFVTILTLRDGGGAPASAFAPGQPVTFELSVTNVTSSTQDVLMPSSQVYDFFVLRHGTSQVLWAWSWGLGFLANMPTISFAPNETKTWTEVWTPTFSGDLDAQGCLSTGAEQKKGGLDLRASEFRSGRRRFRVG